MSEISNIGFSPSLTMLPASGSCTAPAGEWPHTADALALDALERSRHRRILIGAAESSSLGLARINAIRAQIAEGTFETPERLEGTITRLLRALR